MNMDFELRSSKMLECENKVEDPELVDNKEDTFDQ